MRRRKKVFGLGRPRVLDHNAKTRIMHRRRPLSFAAMLGDVTRWLRPKPKRQTQRERTLEQRKLKRIAEQIAEVEREIADGPPKEGNVD